MQHARCFVVVMLPCAPQIASSSGLSDRFDRDDLAGTARVMSWVNMSRAPGSMDDPNSPATPRQDGSFVASSLQGGDSTEFNLLQTIRRLQQEQQEKDRALAEKDGALAALVKENEMLRSQNQELAVTAKESAARATKKADQWRLQIRAQAARLKRMCKQKTEEPKRGRFTRVRPDQMACSAVELNAGASLVMSTTTLAAGSDPKRGRGQPRKWGYHKKAMDAIAADMFGA